MTNPIKKIIWFNTALHQSGGGERLSLETMRCFERAGIEAYYVVYWYDKESVFNGHYHNEKIISMPGGQHAGAISRLHWLRKIISEINPDRIFTQATWSQVNHLYLATLWTSYRYDAHVFGSLFAFPPEIERTKYAKIFRKHFKEIRESQASYQEVVPEKFEVGFVASIRNELSSLLKYVAVRKARKIFVLSRSNQWETRLLYGKDPVVLKGAFPEAIFNYAQQDNIKGKLDLQGKKIVLTISRLAVNKRVDLCIKGFSLLAQRQDDTVLVIGGRGPELDNLRHLVDILQLRDKVHFIGYVNDNELWEYFASCNVFVHLDLADFDIAPLEALALGQKVVWAVEMEIDDEMRNDKFIFPTSPNPESVSRSMENALSSQITDTDVASFKEKLSQYTWEKYAARMLMD